MNTTTLNMTPLDGGVIIKKGTATAPPSGGEDGGSDWHYYDVSALDLTDASVGLSLVMCYMTIKFVVNDEVSVGPVGLSEMLRDLVGENIKYLAFGVDYTQRIIYNGKDASFGDTVEEIKAQGISLTEITKEQFYSLD